MRAFWRHGYDGASLSVLEDYTNTGRRSLLNSFGDKKQLFKEVLGDFRGLMGARFIAPMERPHAGRDSIIATFEKMLHAPSAKLGPDGCLVCNTSVEPIARDPSIQEEVWLHFDRLAKAYENALTNAVAAGELPDTTNVHQTARSLVAMHISVCVLARAGAPDDMIEDVITGVRAQLDK